MQEYNRRKTRLIISLCLGMPSYVVFALMVNFPISKITDYAFFQYGATASFAFFIIFELQRLKSNLLNKRMPWEFTTKLRLFTELASSLLITSTVVFICYSFLYLAVWDMKLYWPSIFMYTCMVFFVSLIFMAFVNLSPIVENWKASLVKTEMLEKQTAEAKLEALRVQLSPHFFFNNLSILNGLVDQHPVKAKGFIAKLSDVFRYILAHKNDELVPLSHELKFIEDYLFLLKSRFEEKIVCNISIGKKVDFLIPPVTLQQLIENAVKHNEASYKKPLVIDILREDDHLIVTNTMQKIKMSVASSGIGLENIKQRFALLSEKSVIVSEENDLFTVRLPLLSAEQKVVSEPQAASQ